MNIIVCIKQVPDTADVKWTDKNTLSREGAESVINPCDLYAIETALRLKDNQNANVTAISMGPMQAQSALREAIAMGIDQGILLCDKFFAGSDTAATSKVLAKAVNKIGNFDLIICGQFASDGDTAQTGPSLSQNLHLGVVTNVLEIESINENKIIVKKFSDDGTERVQAKLPCVICIQKNDYAIRLPKISGRIKSQNCEIPAYNAEDIGITPEEAGFKGSPTYVKKAFRPNSRTAGEIFTDKTSQEAATLILEEIQNCKG